MCVHAAEGSSEEEVPVYTAPTHRANPQSAKEDEHLSPSTTASPRAPQDCAVQDRETGTGGVAVGVPGRKRGGSLKETYREAGEEGRDDGGTGRKRALSQPNEQTQDTGTYSKLQEEDTQHQTNTGMINLNGSLLYFQSLNRHTCKHLYL